jgi:DNA-binding transcriptional LysR family regulator
MLDELRHLLLIVEHKTFTAAARAAHLSQPALSASMQRLELALGARLLDRGRRGATLTAAGRALLPRARATLAAFEDGRRAVQEVAGLTDGEVRVGAGATVSTFLLPKLLADYRRRYPAVVIALREMSSVPLIEALAQGDLDLGIVDAPSKRSARDGIVSERWRSDEFVLVASPRYGSSGSRGGCDSDAPFVTFRRGTTTRTMVDRHFPDATIVMELGSISAAKTHVREGIGIALLSRAAVTRELGRGQLVELPHRRTPIRRRLVLTHRGVERLPPAAAALRKLLRAAPSS